jgi:hypothetical protein
MAVFKRTLKFIDVNGSTFEEVYYSTNASVAEAITQGAGVYQARLALLATVNTLLKDVISDVATPRNTGRRTINLPGLLAVPIVNNAPDLAPPGAAMVINLVGTNGGSRFLWMRGGVGTDFTLSSSGRPNPTPSWLTNLGLFLTALNARGWGLRRIDTTTTNPPHPIIKVDGSVNPGQSVLTMATSIAGVAAGSRITIGGMDKKVFPALNGQFTVITVATSGTGAQLITIAYATAQNASINALQGKARLATYQTVSPVDPLNSKFVYPGTRITRNPFSNSRGARRAARLRQLA